MSCTHAACKPSVPSQQKSTEKQELTQQYGGLHTGRWVSTLPPSWIPYVQLARLSPPAGVCLVLFPHLFGLFHASVLRPVPAAETLRVAALLVAGSFFLSNAIHGWNDLIDAPIDALVARTKNRPIVRGAVSPRGALLFTVSQALLAAALLLLLLPTAATVAAVPGAVANFYYPWSKRHTHAAQLVLGVSLGWGVVVGTAATGVVPWEEGVLAPTACLFASSVLWTVTYDTIYAFQDVADNVKIGLKSTAVFFGGYTKPFLWVCVSALVGLLCVHRVLLQSGLGYLVIASGGCLASVGVMVAQVDLDKPSSCWWWFRYGFWLAGGSIISGLLWEVVFRECKGQVTLGLLYRRYPCCYPGLRLQMLRALAYLSYLRGPECK